MVSKIIAPLFVLAIALSVCQPETAVQDQRAANEAQEVAETTSANPDATAPAKPDAAAEAGYVAAPNKTAETKDVNLPDTDGEWEKITLNGYSCGDNCYLEFTPTTKGGAGQTALCSAKICGDWERARTLPAAYKNKIVEVKYSTAKRVDGSSKVVDNFRSISEIRMAK